MKKTNLIIPSILLLLLIVAISALLLYKPAKERPQEPKGPFPYSTEEVRFQNKDAHVTLSGTLTLPSKAGQYPAVILISGSGPHNRDEEMLGHKPFLVIADYLTKNGIAVLRYDDRGVGKSSGDFSKATSFDFATDAESAVNYLKNRKEINPVKIGLIGHSEGGVAAPIAATRSEDVRFIVLLAAPGIPSTKLILLQEELISRVLGVPEAEIQQSRKINEVAYDIVLKSKDAESSKAELTSYIRANSDSKMSFLPKGMTKEQAINMKISMLTSAWGNYLLKYDAAAVLQKVTCPVLALNGEKDLQVPPKEDLAGIAAALKKGGNKNFKTVELPGLNHLFQQSKTGSPEEYEQIEQTFAPVAMEEMKNWILTVARD